MQRNNEIGVIENPIHHDQDNQQRPINIIPQQHPGDVILRVPRAYTIQKAHLLGFFTRRQTSLSTTPPRDNNLMGLGESIDTDAIRNLNEAIAQMQSAEDTQDSIFTTIAWGLMLLAGLLLIVQQSVDGAKNWTMDSSDPFNATFNGIQKCLVFIVSSIGLLAQNRRNNAKFLKNNMIQELEQTFETRYNGPR